MLNVFLVAGELSGDQLGRNLMTSLLRATGGNVTFRGVGGEAMRENGLESLFPMSDVAVMGLSAVLARLPLIFRRVRETADAAVTARPDVLVIIDSPGFTHLVAARVRNKAPGIAIVKYVSPKVWAWRPGRARKMRRYIDRLLALLPFEPQTHVRLGGPPCTYVGHPLIERLPELRPRPAEAARREAHPPVVLVLPGSRMSEIRRLLPDFGQTAARITEKVGVVDFVLPAVSHLEAEIRERVSKWTVQPRIVLGEAAKLAAFRSARAALAASGTVTLELALSGVPMVVAYKVSLLEEQLKYVIRVPSIVLPNLILGENAIPEFLQHHCAPEQLAAAMVPLIENTPVRQRQLAAFERLDELMRLPGDRRPSEVAAEVVLAAASER